MFFRSSALFICTLILVSMLLTPQAASAGNRTPPDLLTATPLSETSIRLEWRDRSRQESGFVIERATLHHDYQIIGEVAANTTSFVDTTVSKGSLNLYRVRLANGTTPSPWIYATTTGTLEAKTSVQFAVKTIKGTDGNDTITVEQTASALKVTINGKTSTPALNISEIAVYGQKGNDTITIKPNVTLQARVYGGPGSDTINAKGAGKAWIITVGGGQDTATGNGVNTSYWADQANVDTINASDSERAAYRVHHITEFYQPWPDKPNQYVSKELNGQSWPDRGYYGTNYVQRFPNHSLWGAGPVMFDVQQGMAQDCPLTSYFQSFAVHYPDLLQEMAVDLGDGTYAVLYESFTNPKYIRVDGDFDPTGTSELPPSGNQWWPIIEKVVYGFKLAYPESSVARDKTILRDVSEATFYTMMSQALADNNIVQAGRHGTSTVYEGIRLVPSYHEYSIVQIYNDAQGVAHYVLRNPYGSHYYYSSGSRDPQNGLLTMTYDQLKANFSHVYVTSYNSLFDQ